MYHRHKILLSLIDAFGGSLKNTDCQKLIFLFCQRTGANYYDFFPYQYGGFSYVLYDDRRSLLNQGHLQNQDRFELSNQPSLGGINQEEVDALRTLKLEVGEKRGEALVRRIYKEYPYYASRSKIALDIFSEKEWEKIKKQWETDSSPRLFTLGYEGISIDGYLNKLIYHNVKVLVDVRSNPYSRKFGFSQGKIKTYTESSKIKYIHFTELGIPSEMRKKSKDPDAYSKMFEFYKRKVLPEQSEVIEKIRNLVNDYERVALMCFEANPSQCHRHLITEYLEERTDFPHQIVHLN